MKKGKKIMRNCLLSAVVLASAVPGAVLAADKCGGMDVAVANVESELLIRSTPSADGEVIGYLPCAAGVIVRSMDEEWTAVQSGSISGYVKTDYLAFGEKAEYLKSVYGVLGAVASWNDVKIFADCTDMSSVIGSIDAGEGFEVLGSTEDWVEIQLSDGNMAYLPAEDVQLTTVLETAVCADGASGDTEAYADDAGGYTETYTDDANGGYAETYTDEVSSGYTETYTDEVSGYTETYADDTNSGYTETYTDDANSGYTETYTDEASSYTDDANSGYYTETYTDNVSGYTETYTDDASSGYTESYTTDSGNTSGWEDVGDTWEDAGDAFDDGITGDEYVDLGTEDGGASADASSDDIDLLAALIYCEAGNQSAEGKVAVGQVVMNRVANADFADTIHDVIYEGGQFTPAYTGWLDQVIGSAPQDCYDAAVAALNGEGTVGDSLYFNGGTGKGIQIGDHQFY